MTWTEIALIASLGFAAIMNFAGWMTANHWRSKARSLEKLCDDWNAYAERLTTRWCDAEMKLRNREVRQADEWPDEIV